VALCRYSNSLSVQEKVRRHGGSLPSLWLDCDKAAGESSVTDRCIGLEAWIERISQAELPALAAVVQDLNHLASGSNASVQQLAEVLLRDAALTSKVLRVANSAYFNPQQDSIKTISRAIILIGFDNVRQIALSVSLIDSLLGRQPREQLLELLARSFHAAVQARNICGYVQPRYQEE